jgi:Ca2+-binding EF-hand superfamily protein
MSIDRMQSGPAFDPQWSANMKPKDSRADGIQELFEQADEDRDDQISLTEFRGLMSTLDRQMRDASIVSNFLTIDTNRDGRIAFQEFRAWWLRNE